MTLETSAAQHSAGGSTNPRPAALDGADSPLCVAYKGPSMNPGLRAPDVVEVMPYDSRAVQPGDVILFLPRGSEQPVVHRVAEVTTHGIRTRGDNNLHHDRYLLQPPEITGRVIAAWRGERRRRIVGGWAGRWMSRWMRWRQRLDLRISRRLHAPYRALARWGLVRRLLPPRYRPRIVAFQKGERGRLQLLLGTRTVGWYDTRTQRWHIDRPFRLVVDEHALNTAVTMALPSAQGREPGGQPARGTAAQAQIEPRQPNP